MATYIKDAKMNNWSLEGNIAPHGDVILVVGTGDEAMRFRVFSQCLRAGSKVFAAMFGPNWREGQGLSEKEPKEISLPDDDEIAMWLIFRALHSQGGPNDECIPKPEGLLSLVVHADKYDAINAVEPIVRHWLPRIFTANPKERIQLYAVVSCYKISEVEWPFLFDLVANYTGSYIDFLEELPLGQVLTYRDCAKLEDARTRLRFRLLKAMVPGKCPIKRCLQQMETFDGLKAEYGPDEISSAPSADVMIAMEETFRGTQPGTLRSKRSVFTKGEGPRNGVCPCAVRMYHMLDQLYSETIKLVLHAPPEPRPARE